MVYEEVFTEEEPEVFMAGSQSGKSFWDFEVLCDQLGGLVEHDHEYRGNKDSVYVFLVLVPSYFSLPKAI